MLPAGTPESARQGPHRDAAAIGKSVLQRTARLPSGCPGSASESSVAREAPQLCETCNAVEPGRFLGARYQLAENRRTVDARDAALSRMLMHSRIAGQLHGRSLVMHAARSVSLGTTCCSGQTSMTNTMFMCVSKAAPPAAPTASSHTQMAAHLLRGRCCISVDRQERESWSG
jgi:hypothetical protein